MILSKYFLSILKNLIFPFHLSGGAIINDIEIFNPDYVLIDGEPLLLTTIKLRFPKLKVVALLNPFDIENPSNQLSSQLFFRDCYSKADISIAVSYTHLRAHET